MRCSFIILTSLVCFTACNRSTETPGGSASPSTTGSSITEETQAAQISLSDDESAVMTVQSAAKNLRRDGDGLIIDVDFRGAVSEGSTLDLAVIQALTEFPRLRAVRLGGTGVGDEVCGVLGQLQALEDLDLRDCPVSDDGLASLEQLPKLKALRLSGKNGECSVSDMGMESVGKIRTLKVLAIDFLWVSEEGLGMLKDLKELQELYLAGTTIGNDALGMLGQHPKLKKVRLAANQIDAEGLAQLGELTQLETVDLSECLQITDQATESLAQLKNLKELNLWRVNLSDLGIAPVGQLASLEKLNLDNTRLTDEGLSALSGLTELTFLHLGSTLITDEGLVHLEEMTKLKDLIVTRTAVTEAGVKALQEKLPETKIQLLYLGDQ